MEKWFYAIAGGAFAIILSLIGAVWWMMQKQISLRDKYQEDRMKLLKEAFDRRVDSLEEEIKSLRKRAHDLADKLSAVRTYISHVLLGKRLDDDS